MLPSIALFEFRYQLRQPLFWIVFGLFSLLTFGAVTTPNIQIGGGGNVLVNSPFAITQTLLIMNIFAMFASTAFVANVVVRDDETGFGAMVRSTRVKKHDYLVGRFFGAFAVASLVFMALPLGMLFGTLMPWLDKETLGPTHVEHYLYVTFALALPTLFATSALFFLAATVTRSMMATYVCVVAFLVAYLTSVGLFAREPGLRDMVALLEPFGIGAVSAATRFWTATERNTQLVELAGKLLWNRVLWTALGVAFLGLSYALFRFEGKGARKTQKSRKLAEAAAEPTAFSKRAPKVAPDPKAGFGQLLARTRFEAIEVLRHPAFIVLVLIGVLNALGSLLNVNELFGTPIRAESRVMIDGLRGAFTVFPLLVAIYYGGELVWREREKRIHEIIGASPAPDWSLMFPKVLALVLVLGCSMLAAVLTGMMVQVIKQHPFIELQTYVTAYILPNFVDMALIAALSVFVQALTPNKFVGYGVMILYLVLQLVAAALGVNHNLLIYGQASAEPLSDLNGSGAFLKWAYLFRAYWGGWAMALLTIAFLLWRRGADTRLLPRLKRLPQRLRSPGPAALMGASFALVLGFGGFIFYNTNILNEYRNNQAQERRQAEYEKKFLAYETMPQPTVTDVTLAVDLQPRKHWAVVKGAYVLENKTGGPINEVHVRFGPDTKVKNVSLQGAREKEVFKKFNYRILSLDTAMLPGERRTLSFESAAGQRGFKNSGNTTRVVDNGTFISNFEFAPFIGMDRNGLLQDRATRRRYGLKAELRMAKLEDEGARAHHYLRKDSDWVTARVTVTTDADQSAIAPGRLVSETVQNGRRTVVHVADTPIQNFFSIQSARYAVSKDRWNDVDLAVYYHPAHTYNIARMLQAMKDSLSYYSANFSPYQFNYVRVMEFPAYATFAQAFAGTIPFSEGIGFIADNRDPKSIDYAYYVTAHEVAHQWWAHQIIGSDQQGQTLLSETLAQYSALMVMKKTYGEDQIRRFLAFELDNYLRSRGSEILEEQPLNRVENQQYIHYRKGSLVMYLLQDRIGEAAVNRALARLVQAYAFKAAPYPRSTDLITLLREEAGPQYQGLITDLFEKITLYDLKAKKATLTERPDGLVDIAFEVEAKKLYADGKGVETEAPLSEQIEVGVFTEKPGEAAFDASKILVKRLQPITTGAQTIRFEGLNVPKGKDGKRVALQVGIDPYAKWIDRALNDNFVKAEKPEAATAAAPAPAS